MPDDEIGVPAGALITAWDQLALENERVASYYEASEFWGSVGKLLEVRRGLYNQHITDLEATGWQSEAATALTERARRGVASVDAWRNAELPELANQFRIAADTIGPGFQKVNEIRDLLSGRSSGFGQALSQAWERFGASGGGVLPSFRMDGKTVFVSPPGHAPTAQRKINEAAQIATDVAEALVPMIDAMNKVQNHKWEGPARAPVPPGPTSASPGGPTGPGGVPPGGPGGVPPGGPGGAPPGGPGAEPPGGAPPGGPGAEPPGGPGSTPDTGAPEAPGSETPGAELPGSSADTPELPPTDPSLAGMPTATLPTTNSPTSATPNFTPSSLGSGPGSSTPTSFTPLSTPLSSNFPVRRDGSEPPGANPRNSTVDGPRGVAPGGAVGGGPQPVPRNTVAGGSSGTSGPGFFPPMMPPMMPGGGMGANGVKPGEAEFAGGPTRQVGGRDSLRAGLRSQLLGRTGEYDDEPPRQALSRPAGGDVLDDELWQVADAAPVSPPEPPQRRGRSWGPG